LDNKYSDNFIVLKYWVFKKVYYHRTSPSNIERKS